ncbi:MAG: isoprenyl transferase [Saprospiraceae bacterium]|uniref:Isoprenyl transferase n=1 Tax=Candidatus Defluviibacterium haderslevense TaxID=2981993 RepID=A0A9D7S693_9BACT|nr:isoprenyl transferase [Candidatus Defluviibacterium haderslevense]MBL0238792.1 isoprenyl transferase [Candidatus Defluviibacterium haderslevense]
MKDKIDLKRLPDHIAIIMDGNGRWAKKTGQPRLFGHKNGVKAVHRVTEACAEMGIKYLSLYAFSTENWNRPIAEVTGLMSLLVETLKVELKTLTKNNIKLSTIGDLSKLPTKTQEVLKQAILDTKMNDGLHLILALNYSSRWEIVSAINTMLLDFDSQQKKGPIDEMQFVQYLNTANIPDPELLIRTSGEHRISNFLLWQLAYSELYFTETLWPDFSKENLYDAIIDYQSRERRFGLTSEQIEIKKAK